MSEKIVEAFALMGELAFQRGLRSIKDGRGLTEIKVDDHFTVYVNPHPKLCTGISGWFGVHVSPYHMAVVRNGWYAGEVHGVVGGVIAGENTEDELIAALKAATASERISEADHQTLDTLHREGPY